MVRPHSERWVGCRPAARLYKPAGVLAANLRVTGIAVDELEAMRLVDGEGLQQAEAAERMRISRSSVGRLLELGRGKVARALIGGEGIEIQEGAAPINYHRPPARRGARTGRGLGRSAGNTTSRGHGRGRGRGRPTGPRDGRGRRAAN